MLMSSPPTALDELALGKLTALLRDEGAALYAEVLGELSLRSIETADQLMAFANCLRSRGGFVAAMAEVLRFQAILRGARSHEERG